MTDCSTEWLTEARAFVSVLRRRRFMLDSGEYRERVDDAAHRGRKKRADLWRTTKKDGPRCGATTRKGTPCQMLALAGKLRCRMHGGLSTGPKTEEGKARIAAAVAESNRRRAVARAAGRSAANSEAK